eukprot:4627323-Amphidinium_carterae.1
MLTALLTLLLQSLKVKGLSEGRFVDTCSSLEVFSRFSVVQKRVLKDRLPRPRASKGYPR